MGALLLQLTNCSYTSAGPNRLAWAYVCVTFFYFIINRIVWQVWQQKKEQVQGISHHKKELRVRVCLLSVETQLTVASKMKWLNTICNCHSSSSVVVLQHADI